MNEKKNNESEHLIFGSVIVGDSNFAIEVENIQEIVNSPSIFSKMPLAPDFIIGIFNLRGTVIPVISLRKLLKLGDVESDFNDKKVAIINYKNVKVGFLLDATGEIIRVEKEEISYFNYQEDQDSKEIVKGAIKLNNGEKLIQLISVKALVSQHGLPHEDYSNQLVEGQKLKKGKISKCITFKIDKLKLAFEIVGIHEIIKIEDLQESVVKSDLCIGQINLRGQIIPIVNGGELFDSKPLKVDLLSQKIIILRGEELIGILVEEISNISTYFKDDIMKTPCLQNKKENLYKGIISIQEENFLILDHEHVLSEKEISLITSGHSKLFKNESNKIIEDRKNMSKLSSYITFKVNNLFGIDVTSIREIIDFDKNLIKTPNSPEYLEGMLNLRGDIVPIVELRALFSIEKEESVDEKIIIINSGEYIFGLIVDSISSIENVYEDTMNMPKILYKDLFKGFANSIDRIVQLNNKASESFAILNIDNLLSSIQSLEANDNTSQSISSVS